MLLSLRTRWQTSLPLMSGSMTSRTIRSGRYSLTIMPAVESRVLTLRTSKRPSRSRASANQLDQLLVVVDEQHLAFAASRASVGMPLSRMNKVKLLAR